MTHPGMSPSRYFLIGQGRLSLQSSLAWRFLPPDSSVSASPVTTTLPLTDSVQCQRIQLQPPPRPPDSVLLKLFLSSASSYHSLWSLRQEVRSLSGLFLLLTAHPVPLPACSASFFYHSSSQHISPGQQHSSRSLLPI